MYAVIETGGKQYRVEVGTELEVELLEVQPGDAITLDRVLLVADGDETAIGRPLVADAAVHAEVVGRDRGPKLIVFKYRPKARSRVKKGHRQDHTLLRITDVRLGSKSAAESVRKAEQEARTERDRVQEAAARQAAADAALAAKLAKSETAAGKATTTKASTKSATTTASPAPKRGKAAAEPTESDPTASADPSAEDATTAPKARRSASATPDAAAPESPTAATTGTEAADETTPDATPRDRTKKDE